MPHSAEPNTQDDFGQQIDAIERFAATDIDAARKQLRLLLFAKGSGGETGTVGEALSILAQHNAAYRYLTPVILRFLVVPGVIPESNPSNQIARSVVELAVGSLPDLCDFLRVASSAQTFEKYAILRGAHDRICSLLAPLQKDSTTLELFLANRHPVMECLHHSAVTTYCAPFGLDAATNCIEQVFSLVRKISTSDPTALHHQIRLFMNLIDEYNASLGARSNFFIQDYFVRFLNSARDTVHSFLAQTRGRFAASIVSRLADDGSIPKRYPLEDGREFIVLIPLRNNGPGTALNVQAQITHNAEHILFGTTTTNIGEVAPGDFSVAFDALVISQCSKVSAILTLTWEEMGSLDSKSLALEVDICAQKAGVPWGKLQQLHPYSTAVAKGDEFVGRREKVTSLASKILRTPMEPFFVTGQKRVGKTSLALAAADFAKSQSAEIDYTYVLWGSIAYENPRDSVNALGRQIADFVRDSFPSGYESPSLVLEGSLAPILPLFALARKIIPQRKYVIIIDEFDEIHPEMYLQGALAETFFANLRALAALENVCLALVGGENMPFIMERQGQKLNKFVRFGLDYFSRSHEWEDFKLLVRRPTDPDLNWHDDAITAVFNVTNGNPYFAKVVCAHVYAKAVRDRDSDITGEEVRHAITSGVSELDTNSFVHLWQDGIFRVGLEREPFILQRCRLLVAAARTLRRGSSMTLESLVANKHSSRLSTAEISAVINDFVRREVLTERDGVYEFVLPLFGLWLQDVGMVRLVSDALAQELAEAAQIEEDNAYVRSEEVSSLANGWPTYRGKEIGADDVRAWFEQVASHKDQRLLFTILKNLKIFSEVEIREKLRAAFAFVRPKLPTKFVVPRRGTGRTDIVITYVDGEGKSGQFYAARFAEENQIPVRSIITPGKFTSLLNTHVSRHGSLAAIVIVDDIVATGHTLVTKLTKFVRENELKLKEVGKPLCAIALAGCDSGVSRVAEAMQEFGWLDFELRVCEPLLPRSFAFDPDNGIWGHKDDLERAKSLCRDLGVNIYPDAPFGYGDQGLLIVFPDTCPNNTLPIIHSPARPDAARKWLPLFPRITN
jgi:AAA+ ATPase superfamily predicted ATPase